jgi:hypothetical protein
VRDEALLENCEGPSFPCPQRTLPFSYAGWPSAPSFYGLVTQRYKYVEYAGGEKELYDLQTDPSELENLADTPGSSALQSQLAAQLADFRAPPAPDTTIVTGPAGPTHDRVLRFTYFSQSRFATYQCRLTRDGVPGPWSTCDGESVLEGPLPDGDYVFEVAGTDENGVTDATPASRSFSIHATGPDVAIDSGPDAVTTATSATFTFSSHATGVTFRCSLQAWGAGPSWQPCPMSGASYGPLADGVWDFRVQAVASDGTISDPAAQSLFRVAHTGPTMTVDRSPVKAGGFTSSSSADFAFHPDRATAGQVTCQLDGSAPADCSGGTFTASGLAEGRHSLAMNAADPAGNQKTTTFTWTVDKSPPVATIASGPPQFSDRTSATFAFSSTEPSDATVPQYRDDGRGFLCGIDGSPLARCGANRTFSGLPDGSHTLTLRASDAAGNVSAPVTWSWTQVTCPAGWCRVYPGTVSSSDRLSGVAGLNPGDVWGAGSFTDEGGQRHTLTLHWYGSSADVVPSPDPPGSGSELAAVAPISPKEAWAVGSFTDGAGRHTLVEHWVGGQWSIAPSPDGGPDGNQLLATAAVARGDVWAVGSYSDAAGKHPLLEHWDGTSWSTAPGVDVQGGTLTAVSAAGPSDVWASGSFVDGAGTPSILLEHWDGTVWKVVAGPTIGTSSTLSGVSTVGPDDVWAVGSYTDAGGQKPLAIHWDGSVWSKVAARTIGIGGSLSSVAAAGPKDVWAVGTFSTSSSGANLLSEHWDGTSWTIVRLSGGLTSHLVGSAAFPTGDVWAVGDAQSSASTPVRTLVERLSPTQVLGSRAIPPNANGSYLPTTSAWRVDPSDTGAHAFQDTSGLNLLNSGPVPPGMTYVYTYSWAGSFPVTDTSTGNQQSVGVPIQAVPSSGPATSPFTLRWGWWVPSKDVFDVQIQRPGSTSFVDWITGATSASQTFTPDGGPGKYSFRARLRNPTSGAASGWSPPVTITAQ